ncbi:ECF RNA polymerase sigma factor SigL [compost metagenome]
MAIILLNNENDLLAKIAEGDERAFTIIYEFYQHKIYTFCLPILHSELLAEEVVQETMLKLWRMGYQLKTIKSLDSYLKSIARNRAIDLLRHQKLVDRTDQNLAYSWTELHNGTEEEIILNDTKKVLKDAIDQLPKQQKLVYQLSQQKGLKNDEIAIQLNLSPATVQTHLKLAMKFLREQIKRNTDIAIMIILLKLL